MALTQSHFRFGIDQLAENTHGWYAAEDTNPAGGVIPLDVPFLLRFCVQANATGLANVDNEFQYRKNGGTWTNITTSSANVQAVATVALTNGGNNTKRLSGTGTFESSGAGQTEDGSSGGTANDIVASGNSETECGLQFISADLANGDVIDFRLVRDGGVLLDAYAVTPSITILLPITANLSSTLDALTLSAQATLDIDGSLSVTLDTLTLSSTAALDIEAALDVTLDALTLSSTATIQDPSITGELSATLDGLTLSATAELTIEAQLVVTLAPLTVAAEAELAIEATVAATFDPLVLSAQAELQIAAAVNQTLDDLVLQSSAALTIEASLNVVLDDLTVQAGDLAGRRPIARYGVRGYACTSRPSRW